MKKSNHAAHFTTTNPVAHERRPGTKVKPYHIGITRNGIVRIFTDFVPAPDFLYVISLDTFEEATKCLVNRCRLDRTMDQVTKRKEYRWNSAYEMIHADEDTALGMVTEFRKELDNLISGAPAKTDSPDSST